jgi:mRNA-degrading endonuclease toxin of MazEF toxin-antitoxin module
MPLPVPEAGLVICYEFLWSHEAEAGENVGAKRRPAVIVIAAKNQSGQTVVVVAPITHSTPRDPTLAVEIPPRVKRHLGLDEQRSWVALDELNEFVWPGLDIYQVPGGRADRFDYGFIPPRLFEQIRDKILTLEAARRRVTRRSDV